MKQEELDRRKDLPTTDYDRFNSWDKIYTWIEETDSRVDKLEGHLQRLENRTIFTFFLFLALIVFLFVVSVVIVV